MRESVVIPVVVVYIKKSLYYNKKGHNYDMRYRIRHKHI